MKVAIVTAFPFDPAAPMGGVEAVSVNLARALARLDDLEVHVVTLTPACKGAERSEWDRVAIHWLPRSGRSTLGSAIGPGGRRVRSYLLDLAPDLVHAHDVFGLMVKGLPIPRVLTIHGFIYADTRVSGARLCRLRSWIWRFFEIGGWRDQSHIISISPYVRERVSRFVRATIHDIENPLAPGNFEVPREEQPGTIFSAAHICPRKNTLVLVEAFCRLLETRPEARLRLAGLETNPDYARAVHERVRVAGIDDRVALLGGVTAEDVRRELSRASAFVLNSLEENSPMGIAEAMAAGIPVVASNRCGMPYMVREGETGYLVNPMDAGEIAWALDQVLSDPARRAEMGRRGREVALERFHPNVVARRTREVYLKVLRRRQPRA